MQFKFTLSGHFGENNVGDDLLLISLLLCIRNVSPSAKIIIFSADVKNTLLLLAREELSQMNVEIVYSGRWGFRESAKSGITSYKWIFSSIKHLATSTLHLIGPGTIIKDSTNKFFLVFWMLRGLLSICFRKPFAFIGIGVGDVRYWHSRLLIRWVLNRAVFITTRDSNSLHTLHDLKVTCRKSEWYPDLSFTMAESASCLLVSDPKITIGLNFRNFTSKHFSDAVLANYEAAVESFFSSLPQDSEVKFFSFCEEPHQSDSAILSKLKKSADNRGIVITKVYYKSLANLYEEIALCDVFVGTRYHSVLMAIQAGVPTLGLSYERKTENFMKDVGLREYYVDVANIDSPTLLNAWNQLVNQRMQYRHKLEVLRKELHVRSRGHFDLLRACMQGET